MMIETSNPSDSSVAAASGEIALTASAARRIAQLAQKRGRQHHMLRISVEGGGCQGFSYAFSFDREAREGDKVFTRDDARLVIDPASLELMQGAHIDFVEDLMGARFEVNNPQASSSCGCGSSFSL